MHVHLDAVIGHEYTAGDPLAVDTQVVTFPLRSESQFAAELFGDLIDTSSGFLDAEGMLTFDFQVAATGYVLAMRRAK